MQGFVADCCLPAALPAARCLATCALPAEDSSEGSDVEEQGQAAWLNPWMQDEFGADIQHQVGRAAQGSRSLRALRWPSDPVLCPPLLLCSLCAFD
jgi:hypothetical protein